MKINIWRISPGRRAYQWTHWHRKGVMAIGWVYDGEVDDLTKFSDLDELTEKLRIVGEKKPGYAANQLWSFYKDVQRGNIVVAYGHYKILDIGKINSDYFPELDELYKSNMIYGHRRKVEWFDIGPIELPNENIRRFLSKNNTIYEVDDDESYKFVLQQVRKIPIIEYEKIIEDQISYPIKNEFDIKIGIDKKRIIKYARQIKEEVSLKEPKRINLEEELKKIKIGTEPSRIEKKGLIKVFPSIDTVAPTKLEKLKVKGEIIYLPPGTKDRDVVAKIPQIREFREMILRIVLAMTNFDSVKLKEIVRISLEIPPTLRDAYKLEGGIMFNFNHYLENKNEFFWIFNTSREIAYMIHPKRDQKHMKLMRELLIHCLKKFVIKLSL